MQWFHAESLASEKVNVHVGSGHFFAVAMPGVGGHGDNDAGSEREHVFDEVVDLFGL
jgi:hypothetical protein